MGCVFLCGLGVEFVAFSSVGFWVCLLGLDGLSNSGETLGFWFTVGSGVVVFLGDSKDFGMVRLGVDLIGVLKSVIFATGGGETIQKEGDIVDE